MPYFPDLSPFSYSRKSKCGEFDVVGVGWLDGAHEYSMGELDPERWSKVDRIFEAHPPINLTRGLYTCELCRQESGTGEYHAYNPRTNKIYIAPALIRHYIRSHQYAPPEEFFEAMFHKMLEEDDCSEISELHESLDFGLNVKYVREKTHKILGI